MCVRARIAHQEIGSARALPSRAFNRPGYLKLRDDFLIYILMEGDLISREGRSCPVAPALPAGLYFFAGQVLRPFATAFLPQNASRPRVLETQSPKFGKVPAR